VNGQLLVTIF